MLKVTIMGFQKQQGSTIEIIRAYELETLFSNSLQEIGNNADVKFDNICKKEMH